MSGSLAGGGGLVAGCACCEKCGRTRTYVVSGRCGEEERGFATRACVRPETGELARLAVVSPIRFPMTFDRSAR